MQPDRVINFCDTKMSLRNYDHDLALRAYVWKYCRHLLTPLERRVTEYTVPITSDTEHDKAQRIYEYLEDRDGHVDDVEVREALQILHEEHKTAAVERLLTECVAELQINCCPACSRVLRTPKAEQCLWCGHDWHHVVKN